MNTFPRWKLKDLQQSLAMERITI